MIAGYSAGHKNFLPENACTNKYFLCYNLAGNEQFYLIFLFVHLLSMKHNNTPKKPSFSPYRMVLAGLCLLLFLGVAWTALHEDEISLADGGMFSTAYLGGPSDNSIDAGMLMGAPDERASLGIGLSCLPELWKKEESFTYDGSFSAFMASRKDVCIPCYSDPVVWEDNPRYTLQDNGCGTHIFRTKVKKGDNIGSLLRPWLGKDELNAAIKAASSVFKVRRLRPGQIFSVERCAESGSVSRLLYDIDEDSRLVICRDEKGFTASVNVYPIDTKIVRVSGEVKTSLFDAMADVGEGSDLAFQFADVFCHQVDFVNDVQEGDIFEVIVEKRFLEGDFRGYGDIVAARFYNNGVIFEAFRFEDEDGVGHYYAADGTSLETQFLKAPLNFTRISSHYSMNRRHPVFGKVRPHEGVDYAAPRGTPVKALGEGEVTFVGWKPGYGRSVAIKHNGGVDTHYAHLARYAKSLKRGDKVEQGQVIGYVGASGTATGPHLDFRVRKNGKYIDPLKLTGNRTEPIPFEKKLVFETLMQRARLMLDGEVILAGM